jgi:hypothetical protein
MARGIKRFGQRQVHGFTGAYSKDPGKIGLRGTARSLEKKKLLDARLKDRLKGVKSEAKREKLLKKHEDKIKDLMNEGRLGDRSLEAGVTSLPGIAKGLVKHPKKTLKSVWSETTGGGSGLGTTMAVGLPVLASAPELAKGDESAQGGRSMNQKLVGLGTAVGGGMLTAGLPVLPQLAAGIGLDEAGARLARGKRKKGQ